jgi:hypothetical protein
MQSRWPLISGAVVLATDKYGPERVEAASARSVAVGDRSYRHVEAMLEHVLDRVPLEDDDVEHVRSTFDHVVNWHYLRLAGIDAHVFEDWRQRLQEPVQRFL